MGNLLQFIEFVLLFYLGVTIPLLGIAALFVTVDKLRATDGGKRNVTTERQ